MCVLTQAHTHTHPHSCIWMLHLCFSRVNFISLVCAYKASFCLHSPRSHAQLHFKSVFTRTHIHIHLHIHTHTRTVHLHMHISHVVMHWCGVRIFSSIIFVYLTDKKVVACNLFAGSILWRNNVENACSDKKYK